MGSMFQTLANAWRIPDLKKKIMFTLFAVLIFRFGTAIPTPMIDSVAFAALIERFGQLGQFLDIISGGTDTHVLLVDLRPKKVTGKVAEHALERAHITANKNGIPFDPEKPALTSGIRLGSPAGTTRGFGVAEFQQIGEMIVEVLDGLNANSPDGNTLVEERVKARALDLCARFPIY